MKGQTYMATREDSLAARQWYLVDAKDRVVGRVATAIANLLRGKGKASFTPHVDCGDFVVVINAAQLRLTGKKMGQKLYYRHTGYPGGVRTTLAGDQMANNPERVLRDAVEGMLPKNRLGRQLAKKLKIYRDEEHPHAAQQPTVITVQE